MVDRSTDKVERLVILAAPETMWESLSLKEDAPVVVISLPPIDPAPSSNTVQVVWSADVAVNVTVRKTGFSEVLGTWSVPLSSTFDGLTLSPDFADEISAKTGCALAGAIPVGYVEVGCQEGHSVSHTYSQTGYLERSTIFIRTAGPLLDEADAVRSVFNHHRLVARRVNNPEWCYQRAFKGLEVEVKFTFASSISLHSEAVDALRALRAGKLPGFVEHPVKAFWPSDRRNRMFDIVGPEDKRGYISFTDTPQPDVYIEKLKLYADEALIRHELVTKDVAVSGGDDGAFARHARSKHGVDVADLGVFRRTRYDIDFESLTTGNVFGMMFDYCVAEGSEDLTLVQCEVEYLESRTLSELDPEKIQVELYHVIGWLEEHFRGRGLEFEVGFRSKLSFMREAHAALSGGS
jgi:hypothetical protein